MTAPLSHLQDSLKLTGDGRVHLFELRLPQYSTVFRFKNNNTVTWQGHTYEGLPCQLQGDGQHADEQEARPTLRVMNPLGLFNDAVLSGKLYRAILTRRAVLLQHLNSNVNIFQQRMWYVERPKEMVSGQFVSLDLRSMTEGPNFSVPARQFLPPEFPLVTV